MSVINYYGNLIVEKDGEEVYIRCFNSIYEELRESLINQKDADIRNFQGDVYDEGVNLYETLILRYAPFSIEIDGDKLVLADSVIDELLEFLD